MFMMIVMMIVMMRVRVLWKVMVNNNMNGNKTIAVLLDIFGRLLSLVAVW